MAHPAILILTVGATWVGKGASAARKNPPHLLQTALIERSRLQSVAVKRSPTAKRLGIYFL